MTNQASEDGIRLLSDKELDWQIKTSMVLYSLATTSELMLKERRRIVNLIRTEKLKLLAEVRERVVGENFKNWGELDTDEQATQAYVNRLKADQRVKLTKMEAEL